MRYQDIIGQQSVKKRLIHSLQIGRISHAQLFLGMSGNGTLALALAYIQHLLCSENKQGDDSCGKCASCSKCRKLIHPDVHFVYPVALSKDVRISTDVAAEWREALLENPYMNLQDWFKHLNAENKQPVIGVEESADILRKLSLTSYEGGFKAMIIWMPEKMNVAAANKLLKILEEPPDKTIFILITENEEALLRTIVSRTQLIKVNRLSDSEIKHALTEKHGIADEDAARIAYLADGDYNAALKLLLENTEDKFFLDKFRDWMRLCYRQDITSIITWTDEIANAKTGREKQKEFLHYGINIIRECMALLYGNKDLLRTGGQENEFVRKISAVLDGNKCTHIAEELNNAILHIERNGNAKIIFTDLSLKCIKILLQNRKQTA